MVLGFATSALAETIRLWKNGEPVQEYRQLMNRLRDELPTRTAPPNPQGPYLQFDELKPIRVTKWLGNGMMTAVFLREDGKVLRVPFLHGVHTMDEFLYSMRILARVQGVAAHIFEKDSHSPYYITVDYFDAKFDVREFFEERDELIEAEVISAEDAVRLELELGEFARRLARFGRIGDFRTPQLKSDGKIWRLLDAALPVAAVGMPLDKTPFDHEKMGPMLPAHIYKRLNEIIHTERRLNPKMLRGQKLSVGARGCAFI